MKHKHAELMMKYAMDAMETVQPWKRWEFKFEGEDDWNGLEEPAVWRNDCEYRRKPRTVNINGFEVPEPVRTPLENGTIYYATYLFSLDESVHTIWSGDSFDIKCLEKGLIHLTEEAAIKHADALLAELEKNNA